MGTTFQISPSFFKVDRIATYLRRNLIEEEMKVGLIEAEKRQPLHQRKILKIMDSKNE